MEKQTSVWAILPVLFGFFVMGFCDIVGISSDYAREAFGWSHTMAGFVPSMVFIWFLFFSIPVGIKMKFTEGYSRRDGEDALYVAKYLGAVDSIVWRMTPGGKLGMDVVLLNRDNGGVRGGFDDGFMDTDVKDLGFSFSYPEENVSGMQWLGRGPYRVWKNRIRGHNIDLWQKDWNNTITGRPVKGMLEYPEFKGYHANIYWAELQSETAPLTIYSEEDGLFLKVYNPEEAPDSPARVFPVLPEGDIALLLDIQAIKSFKPIHQQGPHSQPGNIRIKSGDEGLKIKVWFDFR